MANHDFLNSTLTGLAKLQIVLDKKGGPTEDGQLFEQILAIQDQILKNFGLPTTPDNEKFLFFESLPTDFEVENRIKLLHKTATEYLLSNAKSELQTLRDAQELNEDPFIVLPELKISTHIYTFFVYNEVLLQRKDTVENILHELKFVNQNNILGTIGKLKPNNIKSEVIQTLKDSGVKYLDQYIFFNSNL
jgi:hypothetical protein